MKLIKLTKIIAVTSFLTVLTGCAGIAARGEFVPPMGVLFTKINAPITTDFDETSIKEDKGSVSSLYIYDPFITGLSFAWADCSVAAAAKKGGLKSVEYADCERLIILGIFGKTTVTAYGDRK